MRLLVPSPLVLAALLLACSCGKDRPPAPRPLAAVEGKAAAIAHGGVGSPPEWSDGCRAAVDAALKALEAGGDPVDAAVAGVVVMEDDPRFNAGTGARVRLDDRSIQMDAAVMRSDGRFGAVAGLERTRNPVRVARAVMDSPHLLLQGDGATRFARTLGMPDYDPLTPGSLERSRAQHEELVGAAPPSEWRSFDWRAHWNFDAPIPPELGPSADGGRPDADVHDTVGVAVRAADGRFGVALSTGGMALAMRGRVGDVPILGAGLYAGPSGASAATGAGERIMEAGLARQVHGWLVEGVGAKAAAERAVALIRDRGDIGIIVASQAELAAAADRPMAWAAREEGETAWKGP